MIFNELQTISNSSDKRTNNGTNLDDSSSKEQSYNIINVNESELFGDASSDNNLNDYYDNFYN